MRRRDAATSYMRLVDLTEALISRGLTSTDLAWMLRVSDQQVQTRWRGNFPARGHLYIERLGVALNLAQAVAKLSGMAMVSPFFRQPVRRLDGASPLKELAKDDPDVTALLELPKLFAERIVPRIIQRRLQQQAESRRSTEERSFTRDPAFMVEVRQAINYLRDEINLPKIKLVPLMRASVSNDSAKTTLSRISLGKQAGMDASAGRRIIAVARGAERLSLRYQPEHVVRLVERRLPPGEASLIAIAAGSAQPISDVMRAVEEFLAQAS